MADGTSSNIAATFDTRFNQTLASQAYSDAVLGPCVFGWAGQLALWGMVVGWTGAYVRSDLFKRDPPRRRLLLLVVVALCTMQAGFNLELLYYWTTSQARAAADLVRPTIPDALQPLSVSLLGPLVQGFLAKRAIGLLVSRTARWIAYVLFSIVIVCEFVAAIFNIAISLLFHKDELSGILLQWATYNLASGIWLWFAAAADVGVTVLLVVVLRKRIAGFNSVTDFKLRALCWMAIQSASYTAVLAVSAAVIAYSVPADNLLYSSVPYPLWYLISACYPLALLTALNSRLILRNANSQATAYTIDVPAPGPGGKGCTCACSCGAAALNNAGAGGVQTQGILLRRPVLLSPGTPNARLSRFGEMSLGLAGGGITVDRQVSIHVEDGLAADVDEKPRGGRRPLVPDSPSPSRYRSRAKDEERDLELGTPGSAESSDRFDEMAEYELDERPRAGWGRRSSLAFS
ncbi:hypothetical protein JCM10207_001276 [Rhodosporidiobolus poonsookiae]